MSATGRVRLTTRELLAAVATLGGVQTRMRGSHAFFRFPGGQTVQIVRGRHDASPGEVARVRRAVGTDAFLRAIGSPTVAIEPDCGLAKEEASPRGSLAVRRRARADVPESPDALSSARATSPSRRDPGVDVAVDRMRHVAAGPGQASAESLQTLPKGEPPARGRRSRAGRNNRNHGTRAIPAGTGVRAKPLPTSMEATPAADSLAAPTPSAIEHPSSLDETMPVPGRQPLSRTRHRKVASSATQAAPSAGELGTDTGASPEPALSPLADVLAQVREEHRFRQDYHAAEKRLTNQIKAIERRMAAGAGAAGDELATATTDEEGEDQMAADALAAAVPALPSRPRRGAAAGLITVNLEAARAYLAGLRRLHERRMAELARRLPVWAWVEGVRGIGPLGLAQLVGECGDIGSYGGPAKLWKRMGVAVIGGERQRRVAGEAALEHGYSPVRRAILYNLGESLIKQNQDGPYRSLYLSRKAIEASRPACKRTYGTGYVCQSEDGATCSLSHMHNRARRYMEKRFLVDLWKAWRRLTPRMERKEEAA